MKKTNAIIYIIAVIILCILTVIFIKTYNKIPAKQSDSFITNLLTESSSPKFIDKSYDGLSNPNRTITYPLDEIGSGKAETNIYYVDINKDGQKDKITKTLYETGTAHSYYDYTIELNHNGTYTNITPDNLRTLLGAECTIQFVKFDFYPNFKITLITRELGDTWDTPTMAYKQTFQLNKDKLQPSDKIKLKHVCNVTNLL